MREILFRGKRVDNGEWAESQYPYGTMSGGVVQHDFISQTVGQYTGLIDSNGVKIFEGDIVEYEGKRYSINYLPHYARFSAVKPNTVFCVFAYQRGEVIGNVYDNPELIEYMDIKPAAKRGDAPAEQLALAPAT